MNQRKNQLKTDGDSQQTSYTPRVSEWSGQYNYEGQDTRAPPFDVKMKRYTATKIIFSDRGALSGTKINLRGWPSFTTIKATFFCDCH